MRRAFLALALVAAAQAQAVDHNGTSASFDWTPSTGPVAGYEVEVKRNAGAFVKQADMVSPGPVTVTGSAGETVIVRVRAFTAGKTTFSAYSPESDRVTFKPVPSTPGKPTWLDLVIAWLRGLWERFA